MNIKWRKKDEKKEKKEKIPEKRHNAVKFQKEILKWEVAEEEKR
jgi:hypothetical protein